MFNSLLAAIQKFVAADKAAVLVALVSGAGLLAARFGLRLNASDTAYVGILATALVASFLHMHFTGKVKAAKAAAAPKVPPAA